MTRFARQSVVNKQRETQPHPKYQAKEYPELDPHTIRFVDHFELPPLEPYESFIARTGRVPGLVGSE